ncbi:MAG: alginate lyase family protein [Limimaricola soesokkakensis]|uniref:alginate lyase family protein n=1 Tax=Limimaricola soesokkakensis TaxID=1343159 RepID=UPI004059E429
MKPACMILALLTGSAISPVSAQTQTQIPDTAQEATSPACFEVPEPVVSLAYGSRYTDESEDRSDFDEGSNAEVEAALAPIDDLISNLASAANTATGEGPEAEAAAECVLAAIASWAEADALSDLGSMNANISMPSRIAGIALAYRQVPASAAGSDAGRREIIEDWLRERALAGVAYFNAEAPDMASRNNLRAWAGLSAAAVGRATGDAVLTGWASYTTALVACQADEAGALPLEMSRGPLALHYQIHAAAPLIVSAALLTDEAPGLFEACDGALHRIAGFVPRAFDDPELVTERAGEQQSYFDGEEELRAFEMAWAESYLSLFDSPELAQFVEPFRPLGNSKLGGSQSAMW